jgi:UrcA family protein
MVPSLVDAAEVRVLTLDLNLHSDKGVAILYQRIARAAKVVCGPVDIKSTQQVHVYDLCYDAAVAGAKPKADAMIAADRNGTAFASNAIMVSP